MKRMLAFTLVELLVVIGIIAVLIGILLPALGKAREQSKQTACLSNLRQLMVASTNYQANNKGAFPFQDATLTTVNGKAIWAQPNPLDGVTNTSPYVQNWVAELWPFISKATAVMICPSIDYTADTGAFAQTDQLKTTYILNGVVAASSGKHLKHTSEICTYKDDDGVRVSAGSILRPHWANTGVPRDGVTGWVGWMYYDGLTDMNAGISHRLTDKPHRNGQCLAFLDGHCEWRRWQDITCKTFGLDPKVSSGRGSTTVQLYEVPDPLNPTGGGYSDTSRWSAQASN